MCSFIYFSVGWITLFLSAMHIDSSTKRYGVECSGENSEHNAFSTSAFSLVSIVSFVGLRGRKLNTRVFWVTMAIISWFCTRKAAIAFETPLLVSQLLSFWAVWMNLSSQPRNLHYILVSGGQVNPHIMYLSDTVMEGPLK